MFVCFFGELKVTREASFADEHVSYDEDHNRHSTDLSEWSGRRSQRWWSPGPTSPEKINHSSLQGKVEQQGTLTVYQICSIPQMADQFGQLNRKI